MSSFFRSEDMALCRLVMHADTAFDCMIAVGRLCTVQFIAHDEGDYRAIRRYTSEVKRCRQLMLHINRFQSEIDEQGLVMVYYPDVDDDEIPVEGDLTNIELTITQLENALNDVLLHREKLHMQQLLLQEELYVLIRAEQFLTSRTKGKRDEDIRFGLITGSIPVDKYNTFETILWRMSHGSIFLNRSETPELIMETKQRNVYRRKYAFTLIFLGEVFQQKILKLCRAFSVNLFDYPDSSEERVERRRSLHNQLDELTVILRHTDDQRRRILNEACFELHIWKCKIEKILNIYIELNKMGTLQELDSRKYLMAECWVPKENMKKVRHALLKGAFRFTRSALSFRPLLIMVHFDKSKREPPTLFKCNKFTSGFQNLINAYGIASYKELNPAPFAIITFPFLFAVMFGDVGHGIIMFLFALWMWRKEEKIKHHLKRARNPSEIFSLVFAGRYIILFMGLFSIYTGLLYNVVFSKSINLLGSHWRVNYDSNTVLGNTHLELNPHDPKSYTGTPYVLGIDPIWGVSGHNAINTFNSIKMKLAIILGVSQMLFGMALSAVNYKYFRNPLDLYLVFIPQLVFLSCLFLYLALMIVIKWCRFGGHYDTPYNAVCAPSILITFINMVLFKSDEKNVAPNCDVEMFPLQKPLQWILIVSALISVPVLLFGKPIVIMRERKKIKTIKNFEEQRLKRIRNMDKENTSLAPNYSFSLGYMPFVESQALLDLNEKEVDMTELWIHQGIHCIDSVLGAVSHTASYLRLWALSLAHDQLACVLWDMVLAHGLKGEHGIVSSIILVFAFGVWAILTVAILVVMEGLSAFLHTVRLHWVEFQSKFYSGAGELFNPFCLRQTN